MRKSSLEALLALVLALAAIGGAAPRAAAAPPSAPLAQYRAWMEEARATYAYKEPLSRMWAVMMCESGGNPAAVGARGLYHGLFQYARGTWRGRWNPYNTQPINDPKSQIFATAKAWHEGYQSWWGCYRLTR